ncbi:MAG: isochorismatase family protein [Actinomycetota bacterium]|nr:isochorismatase family protein [Actinomycetota bacterium]
MTGQTLFWDVDTQVDFMDPEGGLYVPGAEALRPNLARLTDTARAAALTIVHTADDHELSDAEIAETGADFVDTFPPHCLRHTHGAARVPETAAAGDAVDIAWDGAGYDPAAVASAAEVVLRKKRFDAFSNPAAAQLLRTLDPARVVVYGVALDICDRYAVEGMLALDAGFEIVVVSDAVAAVDKGRGDDLLDQWRHRGVRVVTTDEVLAEVAAASPPQ